ncbi:MAG: response regulator, partial [Desulfobacteraceae bacterium]|nr:response regulator [Desulfobacteraceae bacterium]
MRILIVDDELVSREKLRKIMDSFGQCIVVDNGADALRVATSQDPPDLILLDIIMPGMDGYAVCKTLKAKRRTSDIPVIFISSRSGEEDEAQGLGLGAVDYITKPFSPSIVKARVRTHLELKKHRNRLEELVNERTVELNKATKEMQVEIAERKQAEEALRESEEKYRDLVNNTPDLFYRTDMEGKIIFVSPSVHRLSGYTVEEAIGMKMAEEIYAKSEERAIFLAKLKEDGYVENFEAQLKRKDGSIWWVSTNAHFFMDQDGNIKGMEGIARDITLQKKSETALKESEARLRKAQSVAKIGNWEYDISTGKIWGSEEAFKIYGIERISPQLPLDRIAACIPGARTIDKALIDLIQENKKYDIHFEVHREVDGEVIWIHSIAELVWEDDVPKKVLGVIQDVTDQKKAEKEREDLETQLRRAQKMEAIGTLAGGVAHDLNNILGGLVSYPELLLLQLPEDSPLRKSIMTIQKSGEKAAAVVQDLLTLARRGVVVTEVVNLHDVIAEYLKSPEHENLQSYHPGVHLETHLEKDTLKILGSSTHLSKTVMNLVSNAAEAMPEGGKLTISTENRYIDRPVRGYDDVKEGDYVVLTISDTGTGISPDDMDKIFEPFYTKKKMGRSGTGLGMAVVWGTVKDHNGYIDVQSIEGEARPPRLRARDGGQGTTFTLYFPVTRKELSEDKSYLAIESYRGDGESILIVDDVEEQRQIASGILMELGYSVISVSSGEEAVAYLRTNKADLLVLDMIMDPGMDGLDTYKKILKLHPGQKAIIASGFSETNRVKKVQNLGAGAYIRKPFL